MLGMSKPNRLRHSKPAGLERGRGARGAAQGEGGHAAGERDVTAGGHGGPAGRRGAERCAADDR